MQGNHPDSQPVWDHAARESFLRQFPEFRELADEYGVEYSDGTVIPALFVFYVSDDVILSALEAVAKGENGGQHDLLVRFFDYVESLFYGDNEDLSLASTTLLPRLGDRSDELVAVGARYLGPESWDALYHYEVAIGRRSSESALWQSR